MSLTDAVRFGNSSTPRLLPTPTASDVNDGDSNVLRRGRDEPENLRVAVRLLPTADGEGGRQEKGAMGAGGVRPSGHKATLPSRASAAMREEISDRPFASDGEDGQMALLPTPVANDANPGAGGELRAALVHGEGRRNETGVDSLGRPNHGRRGEPLLPTPCASLGDEGRGNRGQPPEKRAAGGHSVTLEDVSTLWRDAARRESGLLPTPTTQDAANTAGDSQRKRNSEPLNVVAADLAEPVPGSVGRDARERLLPTPTAQLQHDSQTHRSGERGDELLLGGIAKAAADASGRLLPTPQAADGERASLQGPRHYAGGGDTPTLLGAARRAEVNWGVYEGAVRRWEAIFGEAAPTPTDDRGRLNPDFVRWMLGYPAGWFDIGGDVSHDGEVVGRIELPRTKKLRALGNSVQVQCAEQVGAWLAFLVTEGLL